MTIKYIDRRTGSMQTEHPPSEGLLKFLYDNPLGKTALLPLAKRKIISEIYGRKMDSEKSANRIQAFVDQLGIDMSESERKISEFKSFNDFFYRKLKESARPIEDGFTSPGDGRLLAFQKVSDVNSFFVKGREFTLAEFLADAELAKRHEHDAMIILRLAPNDYHRYHFPWEGIAASSKQIKGSYFSVSPHAIRNNFTKVFCENKREYCLLQTKEKGEIVIAPVGATMVGSIFSTYPANGKVLKGSEMGYFAFGGSTVVLFVDNQKLTIDSDLLENTGNGLETYVKMGERIGT